MKKLLAYLLTAVMLFSCLLASGQGVDNAITEPKDSLLKIGDYIVVGQYNNTPILWRYAADDDNGKLIVSDKILCFKRYTSPREGDHSSNSWTNTKYWSVSTIRAWLNSDESAGNVIWADNNPPLVHKAFSNIPPNGYDDEAGFLSDGNFSQTERNLIKSVTLWTMLDGNHTKLSENGLTEEYSAIKQSILHLGGSGRDNTYTHIYYDVSEAPQSYYGAAQRTTDKVFLLDEMQLYEMWKNFGMEIVDIPLDDPSNPYDENGMRINSYMLRSGFIQRYGSEYTTMNIELALGVRPAFYLNEEAIETMTGSGTIDDPYVLNGKPEERIEVFYGGVEIEFDVPPVIRNDRTLVPFRAIFEAMGASVEWEEATEQVTGKLNEDIIKLTIGSDTAFVNDKPITLDVAPKLMNDRTLIPLRFVEENFGFKVEWNEAEQRIDINSIK